MSFLDQYNLSADPTFIQRVQMAAVKSAIAIIAESYDTPNHAARVGWAHRVLAYPPRQAAIIAVCVASNPAITADSTDADLEFTVNSQIGAYAGVAL